MCCSSKGDNVVHHLRNSADVGVCSRRRGINCLCHTAKAARLWIYWHRLGAADLAIWDARGPLEYSGEKVLAAKAGHLPGAINFEWTAGMDFNDHLRIRQDIAEVLEKLGITPDKEVITHCQTHRRSGFTYLVAKSLGYPRVKAYAGSWSEWGNHPDTPVEV